MPIQPGEVQLVRIPGGIHAESVVAALRGRGIPVSKTHERRVRDCTDPARLGAWLLAAARVERAEQVFEVATETDDGRGTELP